MIYLIIRCIYSVWRFLLISNHPYSATGGEKVNDSSDSLTRMFRNSTRHFRLPTTIRRHVCFTFMNGLHLCRCACYWTFAGYHIYVYWSRFIPSSIYQLIIFKFVKYCNRWCPSRSLYLTRTTSTLSTPLTLQSTFNLLHLPKSTVYRF